MALTIPNNLVFLNDFPYVLVITDSVGTREKLIGNFLLII